MGKKENMMDEVFMVIAVFGSISYAVVSIIKSISDYRLKKRLIDKAVANEKIGTALSETLKSVSLSTNLEQNRYPSLKWGLLFLFGGIGLIVIEYLDFDHYNSTLPYGIVSASIALGFLIYYFFVKNEMKNIE